MSSDLPNRRNYYRILHVRPDAPTELIRVSYLTLVQRLKKHPDLGGDHAEASLIDEAFATLIDPEKRAAYDRPLSRDRADPGYRSHAGRPEGPKTKTSADSLFAPHACAFCGAAHSPGEARKPDAVCARCDSPLHPRPPALSVRSSRRATDRVPRQLPITFIIAWPQARTFQASTTDVSAHGLRFISPLDLVPGERIRIDCQFYAAVAMIRHSRIVPGSAGAWDVGAEFLTLLVKPVSGLLQSTDA